MRLALVALFAFGVWFANPASAQDVPGKDVLPPPREVPLPPRELPGEVPQRIITIRTVPGPQLGRRNVWELYAVDSRGRFVPRVVFDEHGAYYLSNGRPYPWTTLEPQRWMPYTSD